MAEESVRGVAATIAKLQRLPDAVRIELQNSFQDGILKVHESAVKSIQEHQSAGIKYKHGGVEHVASEPGYAPNSDTGKLAQSIQFEMDPENLTARVGTGLEYGRFLELGTQNIAARPWLMPAWEANKPSISDIVKAIKEAFKGVQSA